jgi:hypothetical protein
MQKNIKILVRFGYTDIGTMVFKIKNIVLTLFLIYFISPVFTQNNIGKLSIELKNYYDAYIILYSNTDTIYISDFETEYEIGNAKRISKCLPIGTYDILVKDNEKNKQLFYRNLVIKEKLTLIFSTNLKLIKFPKIYYIVINVGLLIKYLECY